jgi:hypothetical protein
MTSWIRTLGLALGLAVAAPAMAEDARQLPIYADGLAPGWNNWSWANVRLGVASTDNERPIAVDAAAWTALYFQSGDVDTAGYTKLSFYVNGGPTGGQTLSVMALVNGQPAAPDAYFRVTPIANEWTRIEAPLAALAAENKHITGFWIQNGSAETAPRFFVNYVALE